MTNSKTTKKALFTSVLSLLLCCAMLIGTTFAWFTDSVSSVNNKIVAGNLDVELEYYDADDEKWVSVDENTNVFTNQLWEPGHTEVVYLKVSNLGTLALKYSLGVNVASEKTGINVAGETFKLSDYIEFGVKDVTEAYGTRTEAREAVASVATKLNVAYSNSSTLYAKNAIPEEVEGASSEKMVAMVVYMPETVGNEANYKTGTNAPEINLGINLYATQYTYEADSFDELYDKDAAWTGAADTSWYNTTDTEFVLDTAEELAGLAVIVNSGTDTFANKTVKLGADMDLNNINWTPIGTQGEKAFSKTFAGSFYGNGYTISNLRVVGDKALGLFGRTGTAAHIEDVTIDGAYVSGNDYVGAIAGYAYLSANCIRNCVVTNATIIATPYIMENGNYDGGAKAGVIVGYALNGNLIGNTAKNSTVTAYRDLGGIAGMLNADGIKDRTLTASGNTIEEVTLNYIGVAGTYAEGKVNENMNDIVGRIGSKSSVADDNSGTATKNEANVGAVMIFTLDELIKFAADVNAGNDYAGKTVILGADIDLANMEWTPIGTTDAGFKGTFDGNGKTISNLKITGNKSTVGLFANTYKGEIKNLTVENATVSGYLNVGVVAGNPYTSKYSKITVKGHVEVNGMSYVGGVGGKNAYADWTDITVAVDETSYVKALSTEGETRYRTYVGGVVGFNGEGNHTFKNITSNIDVIGDVCDIGGAFGIAHYNNKFENIIVTGDVTLTTFVAGKYTTGQIGGIAGTWHNANGTTVSLTNCVFSGKIILPEGCDADVTKNSIVGAAYSETNTGVLIIDGKDLDGNWAVTDVASLENALTKGGETKLYKEVTATETLNVANGANVALDLNGNTLKSTILAPNATLTVTNGKIASTDPEASAIEINAGTLVLTDVEISSARHALRVDGDVNVTINGGTYGITPIAGKTQHALNVSGNAKVVINGGTFVGPKGTVADSGAAVNVQAGATVIINGGDFSRGKNNTLSAKGTLSVVGGTFDQDPTPYVASGYKATKVGDVYMVTATTTDVVANADKLIEALESGRDVVLVDDVKIDPAGMSNAYGTTGINVKNGQTIDGQGNTLDIKGAGGTWDSGINTTGGLIKNITVTGSFRGIFINHNSDYSEKVVLENVIIDGTTYTISCDQGLNQGLEAANSTFNGWTSYAATIGEVKFTDCYFGEGNGYAYCRPYATTTFVGCDFEAGFEMDPRAAVTFENCTIGGVALTADNLATLVTSNIANATVIE